MARCGCASTCACAIQAGEGITVTGTGNPGTPYVISTTGSGTSIQVVDGNGVNLTLTGTGTDADPYILTAAAVADPIAGNLVTVGANGILVSCEAVSDCIGGRIGNGLTYDGATLEACLSTDAGNTAIFGTDGCIYVPPSGAGATVVQAVDTGTIDMTVTGTGTPADPYLVSATVDLSADPGQLLTTGADGGLLLNCAALEACEVPLASGKRTMSANQTVPASPGSTLTEVFQTTWNGNEYAPVGLTANAGGFTVNTAGRYLIAMSQRDNANVNSSSTAPGFFEIASQIQVNGVNVVTQRMDRSAQQTHVMTPSVVLDLSPGDVITTFFSIHREGGPTVPHLLPGDVTNNWLAVQQLPIEHTG